MSIIKKLRKKIDKVDKKLLEILAERFKLTGQLGIYKKKHHLPIEDKKREKEIFKKRKILAKKLNLDSLLIEKIFKLIIKNVKKNHKKIKKL